jgi:hypothetical protein
LGAAAIFTVDGAPAVAAGTGVASAAMGAAVTWMTEGSGRGVCGVSVGTILGLGEGAAVGGTFIVAATVVAGAAVGTCSGIGAGEAAITACVGSGLGALELTGAGVGFGGAVGANFASS